MDKQELLKLLEEYCDTNKDCQRCCFRVGQDLECMLGAVTSQLLYEIGEEE
jgi:hypothetical protein